MESVFTSAKKVFYDNFLQYATTGDSKYKTAYEAAQRRMDDVVKNMEEQVKSIPTEDSLRKTIIDRRQLSYNLIEDRDEIIEAEMRGSPLNVTPTPPLFQKYVIAGVLVCSAVVLASI